MHGKATNRTPRDLNNTFFKGLLLKLGLGSQLSEQTDASWAAEESNDRRNFDFLQKYIALSSIEADYVAVTKGICHVLQLRQV